MRAFLNKLSDVSDSETFHLEDETSPSKIYHAGQNATQIFEVGGKSDSEDFERDLRSNNASSARQREKVLNAHMRKSCPDETFMKNRNMRFLSACRQRHLQNLIVFYKHT